MKIVIVGGGKIGAALVGELSGENHDITIVDAKSEVVQGLVNNYDVLGVIGNGGSYNVLVEAGVETADIIIAVTDSDELNLLCCLIAKKAGRCETVARVRNPVYFDEIGFIKEELGISIVLNPERAAAREIAGMLRFPNAMEVNRFSKGRIEMLKYRIHEESIVNGMTLVDIQERLHCDILICAVERNKNLIIPTGGFALEARDIIYFVAPQEHAMDFFQKVGEKESQIHDVMIVGGSKTAFYLSQMLNASGIDVKIIDQNIKRCEELSDQLQKAMVICGSGMDKDVLMEEGLMDADAFISLTNFDEENIFMSLYVQSQTNVKLITKVKKLNYTEMIEKLDLGSMIYPEYLTAQYIVQYIRAKQNTIGSNIENLYKIMDGRAEALEFKIQKESPVIGTPISQLPIINNLLICAIYRNGKGRIPNGNDTIQLDDNVVVVTTKKGLHDIKDILAK